MKKLQLVYMLGLIIRKSEAGIIWSDRDLNIDWNFKKYSINENELIISEKDKKNISFKEYKKINNIE